ncbi:hypothetical protein NUITMVP1_30740 [Proteus mirabilis]|nr:hypothetical protein NUITMVP1_30740 [Proteus mirabilis]
MTYILIVFLLFALGLIKYALNLKKQSIVPFLILTLFIGLRDGIGSDFNNYYEYFLAFNSIEYNIKYEPIYFYLNTLLPNIYTVNLISSLIMFIPLYIICNKYKINSYLFCILFMFSDSFFASFNIVRQLISASWIMLSFAYLLEKNIINF